MLAAALAFALLAPAQPAAVATETRPAITEPQACPGHGRNNGPAGPTSGSARDKIERVISAAKSMTGRGLSYSWGAGGKGGPSCGIKEPSPGGHIDYNVFGFDCSGFTLYAFWKGAGINIGDTAAAQFKKGRKIPRGQMRRGDLVFWKARSGRVVHVAIYLGGNQIVEAAPPRGKQSVHITTLYTTKSDNEITSESLLHDQAARFIS